MNSTVLIVDDNQESRELFSLALNADDYEVVTCASAKKALSYIAESKIPDLILCDLMMPGMSGEEFITHLRQTPELSAIPIVVVSGSDDLKKRAQDMGANGYLMKPFDLEQLEATVSDHVRKNG